jgi:phage tail sheath protein FI
MPVYLSPGVFTREVSVGVLPTATGPILPAFIGTAKKGPLNVPVLCSSAQQAIDVFGEPIPESYLMYAVLASFEENTSCYVMRVGIECEDGQAEALADVCIDNSGAKGKGWGRIPLFTGIDYGRINLREISTTNPVTFHAASVNNIDYSDVVVSSTDGPTTATLNVTGTYTGDVDDAYVMIITSAPNVSDGAPVAGAGYQIIKNSTGEVVSEGVLADGNDDGTSDTISIGDGLTVQVVVTSGVLDENDTFTFEVVPDNRELTVAVEGVSGGSYTMPSATYTDAATFVAALNALLSGEDYQALEYTLEDGETVVPILRTTTAGERIQLMSSQAFALEVGTQQYAWDIPRSYLLGITEGPYNISSANNRVKINVIGTATTKTVEFNVPNGIAQSAVSIANVVDLAGVVAGDVLWESFALTVPGGGVHVVIVTTNDHQFDTLFAQASYSNLKTLRFCEELDIPYPYKRAYRGYSDNRLTLPDAGESDPSVPLSCEVDPLSSDCTSDTAYFANVVGWLVAPSAGTWVNNLRVSLELYTDGIGESAGRYRLVIKDNSGAVLDAVDDVNFDKRTTRYIGNVVNPGSALGGASGNAFVNWEERPAYLNNDTNSVLFDVRLPSQVNGKSFQGQQNGIPLDPAYSVELDAAVIGTPSLSTGLYAFQNPENLPITVLATPGFSSGAVIGTALQVSEARGDVIYLVDPPFGLRPQQVVDWHNGMLLSDLNNSINSSYGALNWSWIKYFDQFNSAEIWVPPSGHVSAVYARTAREREVWFAPAGVRRGRLITALDVEYAPSLPERDLLYGNQNAVNPIAKFPREGIVLYGQKTLDRTGSLTNRVSTRMLTNALKREVSELLRPFIFEPNDSALWSQVQATLEPYMSNVQTRRGVTAWKVVVDQYNNTPERIDRGELWVTIFYRPTRAVEFVVLNLVQLRTGASFSAEEVLAAGGIATA